MAITVPVNDETTIYDATDVIRRAPLEVCAEVREAPSVRSVSSRFGLATKRSLDVLLAGTALLIITPIMALITIAVALSSPGLPWFGQARLGRHGEVFRCWKFRSMHRNAEELLRRDPNLYATYVANDYKLNCEDDPRVTTLGRFLRKTSLDELPQLVNVLLGHMSMVGPRPVVPDELERCYGPWAGEYLAVRPGITGPWQISGRNDIRYPERAELDAHYVNTWTLWNDVTILARTPIVLVRKAGVQ
jgi:exopolysaccharide production protein ExoY